MSNIVSGKQYSNNLRVKQCCCGCTTKTGCLIIGWLNLITGLFYIARFFMASNKQSSSNEGQNIGTIEDEDISNNGYLLAINIVSIILMLLAGLSTVIGVYNGSSIMWASVYLNLITIIWGLVGPIIICVLISWIVGVVGIISTPLNIYFFIVLRSYAYELDGELPDISHGELPVILPAEEDLITKYPTPK